MLLYGARVTLEYSEECDRVFVNERMHALNAEIDVKCKTKSYLMRAVEIKKNKIGFVILVKERQLEESLLEKQVADIAAQVFHESVIQKVDLKEITASKFSSLLNRYSIGRFKADSTTTKLRELLPDMPVGCFRTGPEMWEDILKIRKRTNFRTKARKLMADATLMEEMDRIYSEKHPKAYRGIPVHYRISSGARENAEEIAYVLMQALYVNNRILSKRVTYIKMESLWGNMNGAIDKVFRLSSGGCIVIDMFGNQDYPFGGSWSYIENDEEDDIDWNFYDSDDDEPYNGLGGDWRSNPVDAVKILTAAIEKHMHETQVIFIEDTVKSGYSGRMFRELGRIINLVEIKEGLNGMQAQRRFDELVAEAGLTEFHKSEEHFEEGKYYSENDVAKRFRRFSGACMTDKIYIEYSVKKLGIKSQKEAEEQNDPRRELQRLIGLTKVKQMAGDIIALHKVDKMRSSYCGAAPEVKEKAGMSRHMMFTGNPGTAKTTIARLLAQIMKEEGLLKTGKFVECGRADLVGQYVGWTAVQVKEKFKKARGGVLFIDEAYSLVDDSNTFGDEAINTIVAEMENLRDEVVVIFAGYPDKMQGFLDKNEGLRSRIAHHIHFPDYTPEELLEIMEKLAEDREFSLRDDAKEIALEIFRDAYHQADYGNGRFARNLLERAIFRQASRIAALPEKEVSREQLFELTEEDFEQEAAQITGTVEKKMRQIGFSV